MHNKIHFRVIFLPFFGGHPLLCFKRMKLQSFKRSSVYFVMAPDAYSLKVFFVIHEFRCDLYGDDVMRECSTPDLAIASRKNDAIPVGLLNSLPAFLALPAVTPEDLRRQLAPCGGSIELIFFFLSHGTGLPQSKRDPVKDLMLSL